MVHFEGLQCHSEHYRPLTFATKGHPGERMDTVRGFVSCLRES